MTNTNNIPTTTNPAFPTFDEMRRTVYKGWILRRNDDLTVSIFNPQGILAEVRNNFVTAVDFVDAAN